MTASQVHPSDFVDEHGDAHYNHFFHGELVRTPVTVRPKNLHDSSNPRMQLTRRETKEWMELGIIEPTNTPDEYLTSGKIDWIFFNWTRDEEPDPYINPFKGNVLPKAPEVPEETRKGAWDDLAAILTKYEARLTIVTLAKLVHLDAIQRYELISTVPEMAADIMNLGAKYASPAERGAIKPEPTPPEHNFEIVTFDARRGGQWEILTALDTLEEAKSYSAVCHGGGPYILDNKEKLVHRPDGSTITLEEFETSLKADVNGLRESDELPF